MTCTRAARRKLPPSTHTVVNPNPILEGQNLGLLLGRRWLWRNLSFSLFPGEIVGIRGRSGSGKSMFLRSIVGLTPLTEGTVRYQNRPCPDWHAPHLRAQVMLLPQKASLTHGTVQDNLDLARRFQVHHDRGTDALTAIQMLEDFNLPEAFLQRNAETLSGGEGQIVALMRALQLHPQILLLDEPTSSMDPHSADTAERRLRKWLDEHPDRAILWISHAPDRLERVSSRQWPFEDSTE